MSDCLTFAAMGVALASFDVSVSRALGRVYGLKHLGKIGAGAAALALVGALIWLARCSLVTPLGASS